MSVPSRQRQRIDLVANEYTHKILITFGDVVASVLQLRVSISNRRRARQTTTNTDAKTVERAQHTLDKPEGSTHTAVCEYDDHGSSRLSRMAQ
jgi:hypothetical protein